MSELLSTLIEDIYSRRGMTGATNYDLTEQREGESPEHAGSWITRHR